jgi:hypothetical protein
MLHPPASAVARLLCLSALALHAAGAAGCGGKVVFDSASTGGGGGGAGGDAGVTIAACVLDPAECKGGPPSPSACFTPAPGQACPDAAQALPFFGPGCVEINAVQAACSGGTPGDCCYDVTSTCHCL